MHTQEKNKVDNLFEDYSISYDKDIYSGYLKTDVEGNELFYVFTPSQSNPEKDPLLLWLNGGPGCSSLIGMLTEIGPVIYNSTTKQFELNQYSWNNEANVLFIESPAGVGFTKIKDPNFFFNDTIQAISLNIALHNFFSLFEEYQKNDFYITGESYAGTYIPHLIQQMLKYSEENPNSLNINLKGFLIGNPYTMQMTDFEDSMVEFGFSHALIGYRTFSKYLNECPHLPQKEIFLYEFKEKENYTFNPIYIPERNMPVKNVTKKCNEIREEIIKQFKGINFYGIFKECLSKNETQDLNSIYKNIDYESTLKSSYKYNFLKMIRQQNYIKSAEIYLKEGINNDNSNETFEEAYDFFQYCGDDLFIPNFLNDNSTKRKLGVNESIIFKECNAKLNYKWGESIDFYKEELPKLKNFKAWIYSGADDIAVTTLGTLRWMNYINYTIDEEWKPWYVDHQVAGMEQNYTSGLRFLTVKGVGHMVPEDNPKIAKFLLDEYLKSNV